jgi:hypothetical protein
MLPDATTITGISELVGKLGLLGVILILWWLDNRRIEAVMKQYGKDMEAQRRMYEANVSLCDDFAGVAKDLRQIVVLNTQVMTTLTDEIRTNQFCPALRVEKRKQLGAGGST